MPRCGRVKHTVARPGHVCTFPQTLDRLNSEADISTTRRRSIPPENPEAAREWARQKLRKLTDAERSVLHLVARNLTTQDIATELKVSPKTVENQRSAICRKIGITGNNALLRFALMFAAMLSEL